MASQLVTAVPVESLVRTAEGISFNIAGDELERIAHLALAIGQAQIRRSPVGATDLRSLAPYDARTRQERAALAAHVVRVMQALVALGWIQRPD